MVLYKLKYVSSTVLRLLRPKLPTRCLALFLVLHLPTYVVSYLLIYSWFECNMQYWGFHKGFSGKWYTQSVKLGRQYWFYPYITLAPLSNFLNDTICVYNLKINCCFKVLSRLSIQNKNLDGCVRCLICWWFNMIVVCANCAFQWVICFKKIEIYNEIWKACTSVV